MKMKNYVIFTKQIGTKNMHSIFTRQISHKDDDVRQKRDKMKIWNNQ